jgi:hypothetical protein
MDIFRMRNSETEDAIAKLNSFKSGDLKHNTLYQELLAAYLFCCIFFWHFLNNHNFLWRFKLLLSDFEHFYTCVKVVVLSIFKVMNAVWFPEISMLLKIIFDISQTKRFLVKIRILFCWKIISRISSRCPNQTVNYFFWKISLHRRCRYKSIIFSKSGMILN